MQRDRPGDQACHLYGMVLCCRAPAPAQGACPYANICGLCPSFRADAADLPVLAAQKVDAEALAADAEKISHLRTAVEAVAGNVRQHEERLRRLERRAARKLPDDKPVTK